MSGVRVVAPHEAAAVVRSGCIDVSEVYPPKMAPVCDRGSYGCPIVHLRRERVALAREVEAPEPGGRPSDDFEGAVE